MKYFFTTLLIIHLIGFLKAEGLLNTCADWITYGNVKCFKVLNTTYTQPDGIKACTALDSTATLVSIKALAEQTFLNTILPQYNTLAGGVWLGVIHNVTAKTYKWNDNTDMSSYANWAEGSPQGADCVEMKINNPDLGKWFDEPCVRKNLVVCQRLQQWSIPLLVAVLENVTADLIKQKQINQQIQAALDNNTNLVRSHQSIINDLAVIPLPVGYVFAQLPNQTDPKILWPKAEWQDITAQYAGLFFRAEGGGAEAFGRVQESNVSSITNLRTECVKGVTNVGHSNWEEYPLNKGNWSGGVACGDALYDIKIYRTEGEVRPRNAAIRIWKRIL